MNFFCGMNRIKWIINIDPIRFIIPDQFKPEPDGSFHLFSNIGV